MSTPEAMALVVTPVCHVHTSMTVVAHMTAICATLMAFTTIAAEAGRHATPYCESEYDLSPQSAQLAQRRSSQPPGQHDKEDKENQRE
jgi:hypothetical protein